MGRTGDPAGVPPRPDGARPAGPAPRWDQPWAPGEVTITEPPTILPGHTGPVGSVAWATGGDGRLLLATASRDGTARVW
ncbi:WD40 repeat domain-containing protein, partial [Frankia sp. CiP1_Cm_nod1]|uniref:WD40 repeat domain-containing protein n=1 Tax=Frankia sp. CiP1_Cm_nod1 TaxID=2897160 RepID=UPI002024BFE2